MREQLIHMLTEASELEHNLLCCYLYAAFSLKRSDEDLAPLEAEAVERWRRLIVSVAVEEMGHLAAVNNLLVAVGGDPHFQRPNFPVPRGYHPANFEIRLAAFSWELLDRFIGFEQPFVSEKHTSAPDPGRPDPSREWITPSGRDYETIGEFYSEIQEGLRTLAARYGASAFSDDARQLDGRLLGMREVRVIRGLDSALAVLQAIVEQGEGAQADASDCHFDRFRRIRDEWKSLREANPDFAPAHPAASDPQMRRPTESGRTWVTHPETIPVLDLANALYGMLLLLVSRLYSAVPRDEQERLADAAVKLMHGLSALGTRLARLPAKEDGGSNAGLSFASPRNIGARGDIRFLAGRMDELGAHYGALGQGENPVQAAAKALRLPG